MITLCLIPIIYLLGIVITEFLETRFSLFTRSGLDLTTDPLSVLWPLVWAWCVLVVIGRCICWAINQARKLGKGDF